MHAEKLIINERIKDIVKRVGYIKQYEGLIQVSLLDKSLWNMLPQIQTMKTSVAN